jgi:hypothetical protein
MAVGLTAKRIHMAAAQLGAPQQMSDFWEKFDVFGGAEIPARAPTWPQHGCRIVCLCRRAEGFSCCVEECMKQAPEASVEASSHQAVAVCRLAGAWPVQSWLRSRVGDGRSGIALSRGPTFGGDRRWRI